MATFGITLQWFAKGESVSMCNASFVKSLMGNALLCLTFEHGMLADFFLGGVMAETL